MSAVVTRCSNSTVTEAWATVIGSPAPVTDDETGALVHMARRRLPPLQQVPAVVLAQHGAGLVSPFWREQFSWDSKQFLARVGHRYLSVHFRKIADRYDRYATSIGPPLRAWLEAASDAYGSDPEKYPVDRVSFGYVNTFEFGADEFDLSKFFRLNVGVQLPSATQGLSSLELRFRFIDSGLANTQVGVELVVLPTGEGADNRLQVQTKVNAETHSLVGLGFGAVDEVSSAIFAAKETAKRIFFEIATPETHTLMGAEYDQG